MKIACLSDSHGNIYALDKALQLARSLQVDRIIFMGDAVGYIPGMQCVRRLAEENIACLKGNHEVMLLSGNYTPEKDTTYLHDKTLQDATPQDMAAIAGWQDHSEIDDCVFYHGGPNDPINQYIYPDADLAVYVPLLKGKRMCVTSHTHRPFIREEQGILFVNAGSVGQPRDDGRYGAFAVVDTAAHTAQIYQFDITAERARAIAEFGPVHATVQALADRRTETPAGKVLA